MNTHKFNTLIENENIIKNDDKISKKEVRTLVGRLMRELTPSELQLVIGGTVTVSGGLDSQYRSGND